MKEYKVLTQKDKFFAGKFDPEKLEKAINQYAKEGWRVIGVTSAEISSGFHAGRQEMVIFLEKDV